MHGQKLLVFFLLLLSTGAFAQHLSESQFDHYTTARGLSNDNITGIEQDSVGYIWITTSAGINRFNGSSFVQYHSNNNPSSPASEELKGCTWLSKNLLAIYTSGLHLVNTKTGEAHNLFIPYHRKQYQYKFNMMERALGDEDGSIYVLTRSGFYHFDKNEKLVSRFDYYSEEDVPVAHFFFGRELLELDKTRLLIISVDGLYLYDKLKKSVEKMKNGDYPLLDEFLDYTSKHYLFLPHKKGSFFAFRTLSDTVVHINTTENKKSLFPTATQSYQG